MMKLGSRLVAFGALGVLLVSSVLAAPSGTKKPMDAQARQELRDEILSLQQQMEQLHASCAGESQMSALGARLSELGARMNEGGREDESSLDQGGETCATAREVLGFPYCDTGTTVGYQDNYTPPCYSGGSAPDVVYWVRYTTTITCNVSLCGSAFNTVLHIYAGCPDGVGDPALLCCNDDAAFCAPSSCCENVTFLPNITYYIIVDGAPGQSGQYILSLMQSNWGCPPNPGCAGCVNCPVGATMETEACPGSYPDPNGGCYGWPFGYNSIHCGETWCAKSENSNTFLDHDAWYFSLLQRDSIRLCFYAEFGFTVTGYVYTPG